MKFFVLIVLGVVGCTPKPATPKIEASIEPGADLVAHGKKVYGQNCIACHNPDPKIDGAVGPAIAGSSLELVTSRVMSAKYPAGYKPKRTTALMPPIPALQSEIAALHAFLNQ